MRGESLPRTSLSSKLTNIAGGIAALRVRLARKKTTRTEKNLLHRFQSLSTLSFNFH
jgi:hypothetical protein